MLFDTRINSSCAAEVKISKFEFPSNAKINGRISVVCETVSGSPPFQFEWLRNGIQLLKNERTNIMSGEEVSTLTIKQLKPEDAANYTCIAKNREGMDAFTARLKMKCEWRNHSSQVLVICAFPVPPEWITKPTDVVKVKEGSTVNIECVARGEPEPTVTFAKKHGRTSHLLISPASFATIFFHSFHPQVVNGRCSTRLMESTRWKYSSRMQALTSAAPTTGLNRVSKVTSNCKFQVLNCLHFVLCACFTRQMARTKFLVEMGRFWGPEVFGGGPNQFRREMQFRSLVVLLLASAPIFALSCK